MERARALRPMGLGDILDETFDLYRGNLLLFAAIAAALVVPFTVLMSSLAPPWMLSPFAAMPVLSPEQMSPEQLQEQLLAVGKIMLIVMSFVVAYAVLYAVMMAALTHAVSNRYLGRPASMVGAYAYILRRVVSLFLTGILVMLLFAGAALAMVIPILGWIGGPALLVVFYFWTALVPAVFVVEGRKYSAAIRRSRQLAKGHWLRIFVVGLLAALISYVFQAIGSIIRFALAAGGVELTGALAAAGLFEGIVGALSVPIPIVAGIVLYYDIRVRKEGFDLEILAQELALGQGSSPGQAPEA